MSHIDEELNSILKGNSGSESQESRSISNEDVSNAVKQAIRESEEERERQALEYDRQRVAAQEAQRREMEQQELQEISAPVISLLSQEAEKDAEFGKLLGSIGSLPSTIITCLAEGGDPEEAPLVIRELATNEKLQKDLEGARTLSAQRRLINNTLKAIRSGTAGPKIPEMMRHNVHTINSNTSVSRSDLDEILKRSAIKYGI